MWISTFLNIQLLLVLEYVEKSLPLGIYSGE